jgi:flavodoxin
MKILVVFYSRTGVTKKAAGAITDSLRCDSEEIFDTKSRDGIFGWLKSGRDAMKKIPTLLKETQKDPSAYDIVVIGTPVWAGNISAPVRTYLANNKGKFAKVAFFCTMGNSGGANTLAEMAEACGKSPVSTLELRACDVKKSAFSDKLVPFIAVFK